MKKTVVIHQPDFLPYLGFFHRFLHADEWVILDHVQFLRNSKSWHHRDKIKTPHGEQWLTVAIKKCHQVTPINQVLLADTDWREEHLNLITSNYRKAPFFREIMPFMEELYAFQGDRLVEFSLASIRMLMRLLAIEIRTTLASSLYPEARSNDLLVELLQKVHATHYLSGIGAKNYFDPEPFESAGLTVDWQDFTHPAYSQLHGNFIPYLSCIDLLFNHGVQESSTILRAC